MKKNYNYNSLAKKYILLNEGASLTLRKEMFKEECWDASADRPIPECWTEAGDIKDECWSSGPGGTNSIDGGAVVDEVEEPTIQQTDTPEQPTESPDELMSTVERNIGKLESMLVDTVTSEEDKAKIEAFLYSLYDQSSKY